MDININLDKSVEENAQSYFEKAKKARRKLEGAKKALAQTEKKLEREEKHHAKTLAKEDAFIKAKQRKKDWFEKFKWFFSSDNFLVIGGRDSSSNEVVVKKHTDSWNLVFHSEAPGSPFVVIKNDKDQVISDVARKEAAIFTASHTKAWERGISSLDVFEVRPDQVTKEAKAGEFVAKGSFMVYGKREVYDVSVEFAVGYFLKDDHKVVMGGPINAVREHCVDFVVLKQGSLKKGEISNKIVKRFGLATNEDVLSVLPSGKFDFVKN